MVGMDAYFYGKNNNANQDPNEATKNGASIVSQLLDQVGFLANLCRW